MKLSDYFDQCKAQGEHGAQKRLASAIKVHPVLMSQWTTGERRVPADHCPAIERETGRLVTCEELRPDVAWAVLREQVAA